MARDRIHFLFLNIGHFLDHLLTLVFAGWVLLKGGWMLVGTALASGQVTPALGLPKWVVYSVVPVAGGFVLLFALQNLRADWRSGGGGE